MNPDPTDPERVIREAVECNDLWRVQEALRPFLDQYDQRGERIAELERELSEAQQHIAQQGQIMREQGAECRAAEAEAYEHWCASQERK